VSELASHLGLPATTWLKPLSPGAPIRRCRCTGHKTTRPVAIPFRSRALDGNFALIENRQCVRPLIEALSPRLRAVLVIRFFESLTQSQIATRIGVSQMHVSRLLAQALAQLRDGLTDG
jgi:RNA polymerase sigma-B factor